MKINSTSAPNVNGSNTGSVTGSGQASGANSTQKTSSNDVNLNVAAEAQLESSTQVTISPAVAQLQNAMAMAGTGEVYNAKQVADIKAAIANGQFTVNPEKIADSLIQNVREMLNSRYSH